MVVTFASVSGSWLRLFWFDRSFEISLSIVLFANPLLTKVLLQFFSSVFKSFSEEQVLSARWMRALIALLL
jgi:hypothetical protein